MPGKLIFSFFVYLIASSLALLSCAGSPEKRGGQPDWVRDPYTRYNRLENVAVVGSGSSRQDAERNALANLVAYFGQSIQVDEKVYTSYEEAVISGAAAQWSETTVSDITIAISSDMDTLIGAEIGAAWVDPAGLHYVAAFLNRTRAARVYTDIVTANQSMIANLTDIPPAEKNSFEGYARYQLAANIADVTVSCANLLRQIGFPVQGVRRGDEYRIEAEAIAGNIPVMVVVRKESDVDRNGRIHAAFSKALSDMRFRSGGNDSRYVLDATVTLTPVSIAGNPNVFTRIEVTANLVDTAAQTVLLPYSFNSREGHTSQAEAENRAISVAERRINSEYADILNAYLTSLLPKR